MGDIQHLEFRRMQQGQGQEVNLLVLKAADVTNEERFTPAGRAAFERYVSPLALEERVKLGYAQELIYVSGVLAGMIETKGWDRISMLYIHPDYANKGLGTRLAVRAAALCTENLPKSKYVHVHATDDAVSFYERIGFARCGSRQLVGGIYSTPYRLPLVVQGKSVPSKLHAQTVEMFVFTGTGNSLLAAQTVAEVLKQEGLTVRLRSMDAPSPSSFGTDTAVGLAFPVACFSTYPTVWRFVDSMPPGEGREVFMLGTMGGISVGMQGPMRRLLVQKGYKPVAAKFFVMPGNYNRKKDQDAVARQEKETSRVEKAQLEARFFAYGLLKGRGEWGGGIPLVSQLFYRGARKRGPWNLFFKMFPIAVDEKACISCKRCVEYCPEKAMQMDKKYPVTNALLCQSCQRCVGFCPKGALHVPGKPAEPYRAMSFEDYRAAFK